MATTLHFLSAAMLAIAGLINLAPVIGAFSAGRIAGGYGVEFADPNLQILLRHRAMLFGLLGAAMLIGAARSDWFWPALLFGGFSMAGFAALAWQVGRLNEQLRFVLRMDLIGLGAASAAAALRLIAP